MPALGFSRAHHPGRKPVLNDVELLCLIVAQHLLGIASERKWIRYAHTHLLGMFPHLPQQSGWSKRARQATGLLSAVITELAHDTPSWGEITRRIDSTPVPCGKSRETVKRSDLTGHARYRYCASHSRYFWEFRLYLVCAPDGIPIVWGLANPKIGELEAAETMLRHDRHPIRPDRKDEKPRFGKPGGIRQWVESVFDTMKGQLTLEDHGGRTIPGVYSRIAGRILTLATEIWHTWLIGAPNKRSLIAYDH